MKRGIVITTSDVTDSRYFQELVKSLDGVQYTIAVQFNTKDDNQWELGGISLGKNMFDEFVHIMDTTLIKDISLFDKLFAIDGHVALTNGLYHYMGKFVSKDIPDLPTAHTKEEAIAHELSWLNRPYTIFTPELPVHTTIFEDKYGQKRMRLENDYMIKWKGTYFI